MFGYFVILPLQDISYMICIICDIRVCMSVWDDFIFQKSWTHYYVIIIALQDNHLYMIWKKPVSNNKIYLICFYYVIVILTKITVESVMKIF